MWGRSLADIKHQKPDGPMNYAPVNRMHAINASKVELKSPMTALVVVPTSNGGLT